MDTTGQQLFAASFMPHGHCYLWQPSLVWLNVISDALTALAYYTIPLTLIWFVRRRADLEFRWMFVMFGLFIVACGTTHALEVWNIWHGDYWVAGGVKAVTAALSVGTAILLMRIVPDALALASPAQLKQLNQELQSEIRERQRVETELRLAHDELEMRVEKRTQELRQVNESLQREVIERQRLEEQNRALASLGRRLNIATDTERAARVIVEVADELLSWDAASLDLYDADRDLIFPVLTIDTFAEGRQDVPHAYLMASPSPMIRQILVQGSRLILRDEIKPETGLQPFGNTARRSASLMFVPIRAQEKVVGILSIQSYTPKAYMEEDLHRLELLAEDCSGALERIRAQQAQQKSDELYRRIVNTTQEGMMIVNDRAEIKYLNPRLAEMLGYSVEQMLGASVFDFMDVEAKAIGREKFKLRQQGMTEQHEFRFQRKDGVALWALVNAAPLMNPEGKFEGALGMIMDISERKVAEQEIKELNANLEKRVESRTRQLEETNKELESFSYSVSHDLRAPLRAIDGFAGILEAEFAPQLNDEGRRLLGVVRANAQQMGRLIDDLLAFSRLTRQQITRTLLDMEAVVREAFGIARSTEGERVIEFTVESLPHVSANPTMMYQVWLNLITNAMKFTRGRASANIHITGEIVGDECRYCVSDNGVGFDMKYAHKLFGVFQRLHSPAQFEGTGVGLAIIQRIVRRHGGRVWAEGKVNEGARFCFALPVNEPVEP